VERKKYDKVSKKNNFNVKLCSLIKKKEKNRQRGFGNVLLGKENVFKTTITYN
jgi:hypothetical protein